MWHRFFHFFFSIVVVVVVCYLFELRQIPQNEWEQQQKRKHQKRITKNVRHTAIELLQQQHRHVASRVYETMIFERNALSICAYQFSHSISNNNLTPNGRYGGDTELYTVSNRNSDFLNFPIRNRVPRKERKNRRDHLFASSFSIYNYIIYIGFIAHNTQF